MMCLYLVVHFVIVSIVKFSVAPPSNGTPITYHSIGIFTIIMKATLESGGPLYL